MQELKIRDIVYYTRIIPSAGIYDLLELKVRTVEEDWFVGIEKRDKQAFLFHNKEFDKSIFKDRSKALEVVKDAEKRKKIISDETDYEEY